MTTIVSGQQIQGNQRTQTAQTSAPTAQTPSAAPTPQDPWSMLRERLQSSIHVPGKGSSHPTIPGGFGDLTKPQPTPHPDLLVDSTQAERELTELAGKSMHGGKEMIEGGWGASVEKTATGFHIETWSSGIILNQHSVDISLADLRNHRLNDDQWRAIQSVHAMTNEAGIDIYPTPERHPLDPISWPSVDPQPTNRPLITRPAMPAGPDRDIADLNLATTLPNLGEVHGCFDAGTDYTVTKTATGFHVDKAWGPWQANGKHENEVSADISLADIRGNRLTATQRDLIDGVHRSFEGDIRFAPSPKTDWPRVSIPERDRIIVN